MSMVKVDHNLVTQGLRGKIGNLIFRKRGNNTTVYPVPKRKAPYTLKQIEARLRFSKAVRLAREAMINDKEKNKFKKIATKQGKEGAYSAAISFYMLQK
jgi:hypothetical protein